MTREHIPQQLLSNEPINYLKPDIAEQSDELGLESEGTPDVCSDLVISTFDFASRAALEDLGLVAVERSGDEQHYRLTDSGMVVAQLASTQFPDQL